VPSEQKGAVKKTHKNTGSRLAGEEIKNKKKKTKGGGDRKKGTCRLNTKELLLSRRKDDGTAAGKNLEKGK